MRKDERPDRVEPVRMAAQGDRAAIETLVARAYEAYVPLIGRPPAPMTEDYAALIREGRVRVLEVDRRIAGLLVLIPAADHLLVDNVAVRPTVQGQGIGRRLMDAAEAEARALGLGELRLYTNEKMVANVAIYRRLGYVETHRAEEAGFRRVYMVKRLG